MYSKNRIGNRNALSKLPIIVFQTNLISLIESAEFRETSIVRYAPHKDSFANIASRCAHRKSNLMFTLYSDKDQRRVFTSSVAFTQCR